MILYSLDKSLAINGINLRQEYTRREQWRKCSICWWYTEGCQTDEMMQSKRNIHQIARVEVDPSGQGLVLAEIGAAGCHS